MWIMSRMKLLEDKRFYVYIYLDPRRSGSYQYNEFQFNYEPFYVGIGVNNRYRYHISKAKRLSYNDIKNKNFIGNSLKLYKIKKIIKETNKEPIVLKLKENLNRGNALDLEIKLIKNIGRINIKTGILTNMTDGGDGGNGNIFGRKHLLKTRQRLSKIQLEKYAKKYKTLYKEYSTIIKEMILNGQSKNQINKQLLIGRDTVYRIIDDLNLSICKFNQSRYRKEKLQERDLNKILKYKDSVLQFLKKEKSKSFIRKELKLPYDILLKIFEYININYNTIPHANNKYLKNYQIYNEVIKKYLLLGLSNVLIIKKLNISKSQYYKIKRLYMTFE